MYPWLAMYPYEGVLSRVRFLYFQLYFQHIATLLCVDMISFYLLIHLSYFFLTLICEMNHNTLKVDRKLIPVSLQIGGWDATRNGFQWWACFKRLKNGFCS